MGGHRSCLAQASIATPGCDVACAEAWGLAVGYALLVAVFGSVPSTLVVGDNPRVMAMAAAHGDARCRELWHILSDPLLHAATNSWDLTFHRVRSPSNQIDHRLATIGMARDSTHTQFTVWSAEALRPFPSWMPPCLLCARARPLLAGRFIA